MVNTPNQSKEGCREGYSATPTAVKAAVLLLGSFLSNCAGFDTSTISAGSEYTCVVTSKANVKCFGANAYGQLGTGDTVCYGSGDDDSGMGDVLPAVDLGMNGSAVAVAVSAGWTHTCAILDTGGVKCWGENDWGQLGQGDSVDRGDDPDLMGDALLEVDLGTSPSGTGSAVAIAVSTGQQITCVLVEGGSVKCFGRNDEGQCGRGNLDESIGTDDEDMGDSLPYVDLGTGVEVVSISSGTSTTCATLLDGGIKCWGGNSYGGVGVGDSDNRGDDPSEMGDSLPEVDLGTGEVGKSVYSGQRHHCAILTGGSVKCWGDNRSGQLGLGHTHTIGDDEGEMGDDLPFVDLGTGNKASSMSLGKSHSCAILSGDGSVRCWGKGLSGQLGDEQYHARGKNSEEMGSAVTAIDFGADVTVVTIAAGYDHTCSLLADGSLKCWGLNTYGALGYGDTEARGDEEGEMGDALSTVSLGTGITVASEEIMVTPAPTEAPTPSPTLMPTRVPTLSPTVEPTPEPTSRPPTPFPTAQLLGNNGGGVASTPGPASPTPTPFADESATGEVVGSPSPSEEDADALSGESASVSDAGSPGSTSFLSGSGVKMALYIGLPIFVLALLACICARRCNRGSEALSASIAPESRKRDDPNVPVGAAGQVASRGGDPEAGAYASEGQRKDSLGWMYAKGSSGALASSSSHSHGSIKVAPATGSREPSPNGTCKRELSGMHSRRSSDESHDTEGSFAWTSNSEQNMARAGHVGRSASTRRSEVNDTILETTNAGAPGDSR